MKVSRHEYVESALIEHSSYVKVYLPKTAQAINQRCADLEKEGWELESETPVLSSASKGSCGDYYGAPYMSGFIPKFGRPTYRPEPPIVC
jgi:hypothetical protein